MNRKLLLRWGALVGLCIAVALVAATWLTSDAVTGRVASTAGGGNGSQAYGAPAKPKPPVDSLSKRTGKLPGAPGDAAADWPQFLGASRDNRSRETGLLDEWPADGPPVLWTAQKLGEGYSSVAIVKGVVYTLGTEGDLEYVIALNLDHGEELWRTPIGHKLLDGTGNGPRGTPAVDGDRVYGLSGEGELACLSSESGELKWKKNILVEFGGSNISWGICESLLVDGDRLICTPGGPKAGIAALDKLTGKTLWTSDIPEGNHLAYSSAVPADIGGVQQYVQFLRHGTVGVRAKDGKPLWSNSRSANGAANCTPALVTKDMVFSASAYGTGGAMLKLESDPKQQTTRVTLGYFTNKVQTHHGGMVLIDGYVYASSDPGILVCQELKEDHTKWQNRSVGKGSLTSADGKLILRSEAGAVALVKASSEKYEELGRFEPKDRSGRQAWSYPVVAQGRLFLRDQDRLQCYQLKKK